MGNKRGGLFFGIIMGTLLGVLFAPRKGKELRKQLSDEIGDGGIGAKTLKKNFMEMGKDMTSTAEEVYMKPEIQKKVQETKKKVQESIMKVKNRFMNENPFQTKPLSTEGKTSRRKRGHRSRQVPIKKVSE